MREQISTGGSPRLLEVLQRADHVPDAALHERQVGRRQALGLNLLPAGQGDHLKLLQGVCVCVGGGRWRSWQQGSEREAGKRAEAGAA